MCELITYKVLATPRDRIVGEQGMSELELLDEAVDIINDFISKTLTSKNEIQINFSKRYTLDIILKLEELYKKAGWNRVESCKDSYHINKSENSWIRLYCN